MKKTEVTIGVTYYAKVTNKRVEIRIEAERPRGGWDATNLATGKKIYIKSAQRLQGEVAGGNGRGSTSASALATSGSAVGEAALPASTTGVLKKPRKAKSASTDNVANSGVDDGAKKLSCLKAALKVLGESSDPLNTKEMIEAMESKGYWSSPGGKTPHATLYSAILRELTKGDKSRFVKTERGRFTARN